MNAKSVLYYLGQILKVVSFFLLLPIVVGMCYGEWTHLWTFSVPIALFLCLGFLLPLFAGKKNRKLGNKEGVIVVGMSWIVISMIGALPFVIDGCIPHYVDALFETISGFTTTGSTILPEIEALPKCMLLWRSFTHWLGGMGILVFILAVIPSTDGSTFQLMKFESPGPQVGKLASKVRHSATILYLIYFAMTLLEMVLLLLGGVDLFNSMIVAFGTAGTGGFTATGLSIGEFHSLYVEIVVMVFMFLFGLNFNLYYLLILKHFASVFLDEELHFYVGYVVCAILAIAVNLIGFYGNFAEALRYASFAVISLSSSTGFATSDFTLWPQFSQTVLMLCMFFGAMAGSTGGGFKVSRILILLKTIKAHLLHVINPHSVQIVRVNKKMLGEEDVGGVVRYFLTYACIFAVALFLLSFDQYDFQTNFTSVLTCLNNDGPGFGAVVGPYGGFGGFSVFGKLVLSALMLIGRLEIFPILLLVLPQTWSKRH